MTAAAREQALRLPPRWFVRSAWVLHRAIYGVTGGRIGLWRPQAGGRFGTLRLKTRGRRSGQPRVAILGYYQDGPNFITLAMNGWADADPAWWLNLQAHPEATVDLADGRAPCGPAPRRGRTARGCGLGSGTTAAGEP